MNELSSILPEFKLMKTKIKHIEDNNSSLLIKYESDK